MTPFVKCHSSFLLFILISKIITIKKCIFLQKKNFSFRKDYNDYTSVTDTLCSVKSVGNSEFHAAIWVMKIDRKKIPLDTQH